MANKRQGRNRYRKRGNSGMVILAAILALVAVAAVLFFMLRHGSQAVKHGPQEQPASEVTTRAMPERPAGYANVTSMANKRKQEQETQVRERPATREPERLQNRETPGGGLLAVVIDDMGASMQEARALAGIGVPLTFSIIPGLRNYREVASFADSSGIETMIHIPMQSKGWPQRRLEPNGLLVSMDDAAIAERMEGFLRDIPTAVGANNHMGSEFTEHEDKMRVVLGALKTKGLFFIDSVTSPQTRGFGVAREMGIRAGRRDVFLDNEQNEAYIRGQLDQAIRLAKKRGAGIVICHPHTATIKTLATYLPGLEKQGVTLVPASRLVR